MCDDDEGGVVGGVRGEEESVKLGMVGGMGDGEVDMKKVKYEKKGWRKNGREEMSYVRWEEDMCVVEGVKGSM